MFLNHSTNLKYILNEFNENDNPNVFRDKAEKNYLFNFLAQNNYEVQFFEEPKRVFSIKKCIKPFILTIFLQSKIPLKDFTKNFSNDFLGNLFLYLKFDCVKKFLSLKEMNLIRIFFLFSL